MSNVDLDNVRADLTALALGGPPGYESTMADGLPFCESYLYWGIRHLQRNCDMDCPVHEDDNGSDQCGQPARWDGDAMARLLNAVPDLVAEIDDLRLTVNEMRERIELLREFVPKRT